MYVRARVCEGVRECVRETGGEETDRDRKRTSNHCAPLHLDKEREETDRDRERIFKQTL